METDALQIAAEAAGGFGVLQCQECAEAIRESLVAADLHGQWIEIRGKGKREFILCFSYDGGRATITQNGRHVAIRVGDVVFDNLHPQGASFVDWLQDFGALGGVEVHQVVDF